MSFSKLSPRELNDLIPFFLSFPKFALFANAAQFEVEKRLPNYPCDFYILQSKNDKYFYCFRHNRLPDINGPILMIGNKGNVNENDVINGLEQLKSVEPEMDKVSLLLTLSTISAPARKFLTTKCNLMETSFVPCYNFSIPSSFYSEILSKNSKIRLPSSSFSIGSTRVSDADIVNSTWKFATPEDILQQKEKIQRLPTTCIFENDRPVAFEMIGLHGQLSHQYTFPEYRNNGLGGIVETSIVAKCIQEKIVPIKSVELTNISVLNRSLEHQLWKVVSDDNDNGPLVFDYVVLKCKE